MKKLLLLTILLIATTCFATERRILMTFLSGDSEVATMSMQLPPPGDHECTELLTPITFNNPICELFPGDWVGNGAWMAEHSIQPDRAAYALGCNNGNTPLNGEKFKGNREGFLLALQSVLMNEVSEGGFKDNAADPPSDPRRDIEDIVPNYAFWEDKQTSLRRGDILHLWIQGTAGMAIIDGIETPCFYLAWSEEWPEPPDCATYGGELLVPSYTGTSSHILGLKQVVEAIEGKGTVNLYLVFARAGAWIAYLDDYIVWAGCEANEYVYIANGADENQMYWPGYQMNDFPVIEPTMWIANAWCGYNNSDGSWSPEDHDLNGDHHIWFSEACNATEILDDQHGTAINVPVGKDFRIWSMYPDDDPMGGGGSPPVPEIYPNPFNPMTTIQIELQSAGVLEVSVFNIIGQRVVRLSNGKQPAGLHSFTFDGANLPSGIYFMRTVFNGQASVKKMVLQK